MITIFIPVHNEEKIIEKNTHKLIKFLKKKNIEHEIFFGNNGSIDSTLEKIKELKSIYPDLIRYNSVTKRGIGIVFRKFIKEENFRFLITVDIDLSHDLKFILESRKLLKQGYDLIIGYKTGYTKRRLWYRKLLSRFNIIFTRVILKLKYKDYGSGAKAYSYHFLKNKYKEIDNRSFFVTKLYYLAEKEKVKVKEVPVSCSDTRKSKLNVFTLPIYIIYSTLKFAILKK